MQRMLPISRLATCAARSIVVPRISAVACQRITKVSAPLLPLGVTSIAARSLKTSTGIVGLPVVPNAKEVLLGLYAETFEILKNSDIPEDAYYRVQIQNFSKRVQGVVESTDDVAEMEAQFEEFIGPVQIEELIEWAKDEIEVIKVVFIEHRCWDMEVLREENEKLAHEFYSGYKSRGVALKRDDVPMRQSLEYPTTYKVNLVEPAKEEEAKS